LPGVVDAVEIHDPADVARLELRPNDYRRVVSDRFLGSQRVFGHGILDGQLLQMPPSGIIHCMLGNHGVIKMKPVLALVFLVSMYCCVALAVPSEDEKSNWLDLIQKPYEALPIPDLGLKPLLVSSNGQKIVTKEAWSAQRETLHKM